MGAAANQLPDDVAEEQARQATSTEKPAVVEEKEEAMKQEQPAVEAPKQEEPAVEAPKQEEPAAEAPKQEEPAMTTTEAAPAASGKTAEEEEAERKEKEERARRAREAIAAAKAEAEAKEAARKRLEEEKAEQRRKALASSSDSSPSSSPSSSGDRCPRCEKRVYPNEAVRACGKTYHKQCFRCTECQMVLRLGNFAEIAGNPYCKPHYHRIFQSKGNYDSFTEGSSAKGGSSYNPVTGFSGIR